MIESEQIFGLNEEPSNKQEGDQAIRPDSFDEFIGQKDIVENLQVYIQAAQMRNEPLDHTLFSGPPGLGKTTLARLISKIQKGKFHQISAPNLKRPGDIAKLLTSLEEHDVLFIDEIHRLPAPVEETLYPAMEDGLIDIALAEGMAASSVQLNLPPFTLVGATTRAGALASPMRDRFGIQLRLNYYDEDDLNQIIERSAKIWKIKIQTDAIQSIASRSRRTPRVALRLLRRIWDYALVGDAKEANEVIDKKIAEKSFQKMKIDEFGLTSLDNHFLLVIAKDYQGGPVGLRPLASVVSEDMITLEDFIEPFLVRIGFVKRTPRGRMLTPAAFEYLKMEPSFLSDSISHAFESNHQKQDHKTQSLF